MEYVGSKRRIAGSIVPIIQKMIDDNGIKNYYEPFVGGANIIDKIHCEHKYGFDKNESLIALLIDAQHGGSFIPQELSREDWDKWKGLYRSTKGKLIENQIPFKDITAIGATAFLGSYGCRGFAGGFANNTSSRNYYKERLKILLKQAELDSFREIHFQSKDFRDLDPKQFSSDSLIYCDPPYYGTKPYGYKFESDFNHKEFFDWVRECSKKCLIVCSELTFPDDFEIIWQKEINYILGANNAFKAVEKLAIPKLEKA